MSGRTSIRVTLNGGIMKPRRGFTRVAGKEKLRVGKSLFRLTYDPVFRIFNPTKREDSSRQTGGRLKSKVTVDEQEPT
jgi:hypothetical protein